MRLPKQPKKTLRLPSIEKAASLAVSSSPRDLRKPLFRTPDNAAQIREAPITQIDMPEIAPKTPEGIDLAIQHFIGFEHERQHQKVEPFEFIVGVHTTTSNEVNSKQIAETEPASREEEEEEEEEEVDASTVSQKSSSELPARPAREHAFYQTKPITTSSSFTINRPSNLNEALSLGIISGTTRVPLIGSTRRPTKPLTPKHSEANSNEDPILAAVRNALSPKSLTPVQKRQISPVEIHKPTPPHTTHADENRQGPASGSDTVGTGPAVQPEFKLPDEYVKCNTWLAEYFLLNDDEVGKAHLLITPNRLKRAFAQMNLSAEESQEFLRCAVAEAYKTAVLDSKLGLVAFNKIHEGSPGCIGFLALCVLTAFTMRAGEDASALAYYDRLSQQLECDKPHHYPIGFKTETFKLLWESLNEWLQETNNRELAMPQEGNDRRTVLAFPLAHVALRQVDLDKLPAFFQWARYTAGSTISSDELLTDLQRWHEIYNRLTKPAALALADERRDVLRIQLEEAFEEWDGTAADRSGSRSAAVEVFLEFIRRQPKLSYLARHPLSFPEVWNDGQHEIESEGEPWYEPLPLQFSDGRGLRSGSNWSMTVTGQEFALRRQPCKVIPLVPMDEFTGLMSDRCLLKGVDCAVLAHDEVLNITSAYLTQVCGRRMTAVRNPEFPEGWNLFLSVNASRTATVPPEIAPLAVRTELVIRMRGLRGRGTASWLQNGGPQILLAGLDPGDSVLIDGEPATVSDGGIVQCDEKLATLGEHTLEVGSITKKINIVEPELRISICEYIPSPVFPVTLPRGIWIVLGAIPGAIAYPQWTSKKGTQFVCHFRPVWAVHLAQRGAPSIVSINPVAVMPPERKRGRQPQQKDSPTERWVDAIYRATIKRAKFSCINGSEEDLSTIQARWKEYAGVARFLKRERKRK